MKKYSAFILVGALALSVQASWYWPFGSDDEAEPDAPRLSVLLEPASELIDEASDLAAEGKSREAIEKYRQVLTELDRIELENPERVAAPEFATVRNKRAYVNAAIDSLLLAQAQSSARAVAVSDTTELEKRLAEEKAKARQEKKLKEEAEKAEQEKAEAEKAEKKSAAKKVEAKKVAAESDKDEEMPEEAEEDSEETEAPAPAAPAAQPKPVAEKAVEQAPAPAPALPAAPSRPPTRREQAMADIEKGDYAAAKLSVAEMLIEKPNDPVALNLKAAMEMMQGDLKAAEATLDQTIQSNPRSYYAYYNMARLTLKVNPAAKSVAKRYYTTGREVGGPEDGELEAAVK